MVLARSVSISKNVVYFHLNQIAVTGTSSTNQIGIVLDGTGNFCGTSSISNSLLSFLAVGVKGIGNGGDSMHGVAMWGGRMQAFKASPSIGIDIEGGSSNTIVNTDFESNATAIKFGANAIENIAQTRSEANTIDFQAVKESKRNVACVFKRSIKPRISDSGHDNHFGTCRDGSFTDRLLQPSR